MGNSLSTEQSVQELEDIRTHTDMIVKLEDLDIPGENDTRVTETVKEKNARSKMLALEMENEALRSKVTAHGHIREEMKGRIESLRASIDSLKEKSEVLEGTLEKASLEIEVWKKTHLDHVSTQAREDAR